MKITGCVIAAHIALVYSIVACADTLKYDVAIDWSDEQNPNGVWTYTGDNRAILSKSQDDWDARGSFFSAQRAWANAQLPDPGHVPMWFKSSDISWLDAPAVGMHGSEGAIDAWVGVIWRSPMNGIVNIGGGVWQALKTEVGPFGGNHLNRNSDWRLTHNDTILSSGNISGIDNYSSASPFAFSSGAKGQSLDKVRVLAGDKIALEFISPTSYATFVGVDLVITATEE